MDCGVGDESEGGKGVEVGEESKGRVADESGGMRTSNLRSIHE